MMHKGTLLEYRKVNTFIKVARAMVIEAVEDQYLDSLKQPIIGYRNTPLNEVFRYLYDSYGKLTLEDATSSILQLYDDIDPTAEPTVYWKKIRETQELCGACFVPLPLSQILAIVYTTIKKTGKYKTMLKDWDKRPVIERTYDNFKIAVNAEFAQQAHDAKVYAGAFGEANMAQEMTELARGTMEALNMMGENQATEMANMASINKTLMETVKQQQQDISELKNLMMATKNPTNNNDAQMKKLIRMMKGGNATKKVFYCWTHGFNTNPNHTSCKCKWPDEGHKTDATAQDRKGGSEKGAKRLKVEL